MGPGHRLPFFLLGSSRQRARVWGGQLWPQGLGGWGLRSLAQLESVPPVPAARLVVGPTLLGCPRHPPVPTATLLRPRARPQLLWPARMWPHPHHLFGARGAVPPSLSLLGGRGARVPVCIGGVPVPPLCVPVRGQGLVPVSSPLSLLGAGGARVPTSPGEQGVPTPPSLSSLGGARAPRLCPHSVQEVPVSPSPFRGPGGARAASPVPIRVRGASVPAAPAVPRSPPAPALMVPAGPGQCRFSGTSKARSCPRLARRQARRR